MSSRSFNETLIEIGFKPVLQEYSYDEEIILMPETRRRDAFAKYFRFPPIWKIKKMELSGVYHCSYNDMEVGFKVIAINHHGGVVLGYEDWECDFSEDFIEPSDVITFGLVEKIKSLIPSNSGISLNRVKYSYMYILKYGDEYKIGVSSNPRHRVYNINVSVPGGAEIIRCYPFRKSDVYRAEQSFHTYFSKKRVSGEWFRLSREDISFIDYHAIISDFPKGSSSDHPYGLCVSLVEEDKANVFKRSAENTLETHS